METFSLSTKGELDMVEITGKIHDIVDTADIKSGLVLVFVPGSTGGLITLEAEAGLVEDFKTMIKDFATQTNYKHDKIDSNARSHLRASILGQSLVLPVEKDELIHGTWQQIFFVELDTRARERKICVQVIESA